MTPFSIEGAAIRGASAPALGEMYPPALREALRQAGHDATSIRDLGLAGAPDAEIFASARAGGYVLLTENVADFASLAAQCSTRGEAHPGILMALSSRLPRRPAGTAALVQAITAIGGTQLADRVVYLAQQAE